MQFGHKKHFVFVLSILRIYLHVFQKENDFWDFLFSGRSPFKTGLFLKERFCTLESKFLQDLTPTEEAYRQVSGWEVRDAWLSLVTIFLRL